MTQPTQPGIFHIHIDARYISEDVLRAVKEHLMFYDHHFIGYPKGYRHFAPNAHLTRKISTGAEFNKVWGELERVVQGSGFIGYLEGEYIPTDENINEASYNDSIEVPFSINRRRLQGDETFRETEFHLVMDKDASDPRLIKKLLEAGLYGAFLPKTDHTALVLTAQGYRRDIGPLMDALREYLRQAGGIVKGTLKEERAIRHALFGIEPHELPEIVDTVTYF